MPKSENTFSPISIAHGSTYKEKSKEGSINYQLLRKKIIENFKVNELEVLCDDIELAMKENGETTYISLDLFGGTDRPIMNLVNDLIKFLYKRNLLQYLLNAIQAERSEILDGVIFNTDSKKNHLYN